MKTTEDPKKEVVNSKVVPKAKVSKPAKTSFTRITAIGIVMRQYPKATTDQVLQMADKLFYDKTGKALNPKETKFCHMYAKNFLIGFNGK